MPKILNFIRKKKFRIDFCIILPSNHLLFTDAMLDQLAEERVIDILGFVTHIRTQRE